MNQVRDNLFIGGFIAARNHEELKKAGITAILNVAFEIDDPQYHPEEIKTFKVSLEDGEKNPPYAKRLAVNLLKRLLKEGERVLVHCAAGASRAVFVASLALAEMEEKHPNDVLDEVLKVRWLGFRGPLWHEMQSMPAE